MSDEKPDKTEQIPGHESAVRRMIADSHHASYRALISLAEAKADPEGAVVFEGDYGGQIYIVARASIVQCSEISLTQLLAEIDSRQWDDPEGARVFFEVQPVGQGIAGGMGGGRVTEGIWVHPRLGSLSQAIADVLSGKTDGLPAIRLGE